MLASRILKSLRLPPWPETACYLAVAGLLAFGYLSNQSTCLWHVVTGLPCPGCGMIHGLLALARGDFRAAWRFNHASVVAGPMLLWTGIGRLGLKGIDIRRINVQPTEELF